MGKKPNGLWQAVGSGCGLRAVLGMKLVVRLLSEGNQLLEANEGLRSFVRSDPLVAGDVLLDSVEQGILADDD